MSARTPIGIRAMPKSIWRLSEPEILAVDGRSPLIATELNEETIVITVPAVDPTKQRTAVHPETALRNRVDLRERSASD